MRAPLRTHWDTRPRVVRIWSSASKCLHMLYLDFSNLCRSLGVQLHMIILKQQVPTDTGAAVRSGNLSIGPDFSDDLQHNLGNVSFSSPDFHSGNTCSLSWFSQDQVPYMIPGALLFCFSCLPGLYGHSLWVCNSML